MAEIVLHTWPGFALPGRPACLTSTPFGLEVRRILQWKRERPVLIDWITEVDRRTSVEATP